MGKKKDKAEKSKKRKHQAESALESESAEIKAAETEPENIEYTDYVTAADVMELINSLEQGLDKLEQSNQILEQQLSQHQRIPRYHDPLLRVISAILVIGIIAVGYYNFRINDRMGQTMNDFSTSMDAMTTRIETMNTSIGTMSSDLDNFNSSLELLSANMSTINQNVTRVSGNLSRISTGVASNPYDHRYTGSQWR